MASDSRERLWTAASVARDWILNSGAERWEVYAKTSTVRETSIGGPGRLEASLTEETGVSVRSVRNGRAGFGAASGLEAAAARRAVEGAVGSETATPADPLPPHRLLGVTEVSGELSLPPPGWVAHMAEEMATTIAGSSGGRLELRRVVVQEGSVSWLLTTAEGFVAAFDHSSTGLVTEVTVRAAGGGVWREWLHLPDPLAFPAELAAQQMADRCLLATSTPLQRSGSWDTIMHSEVAAAVAAALVPLLVASPPELDPLPSALDRDGLLTSPCLTVVDVCGPSALPIVAPCDGEGLPAGRTLLVDRGAPRHRIACYRDAQRCGELPRGGALRLSYRRSPYSAPTNLCLESELAASPSELLRAAPRALYLLRPVAPVVIDPRADSYHLLASGVWIEGGRVCGSQAVVELRGGIGQLLRRIDGVGTDLRWYQTESGFIGAPSLLVRRQSIEG